MLRNTKLQTNPLGIEALNSNGAVKSTFILSEQPM